MTFIGPRLSPTPLRAAKRTVGAASRSPSSASQPADVGDQPEPLFYRREEEWLAIAERLKRTPCPHCHTVGTLIRHGVLTGFDDTNPPRKTLRARRTFCSNRHRRRGCGRTFSIWLADKVRRLSLTARTPWAFLRRAAVGTIADATRATNGPRSDRAFRRIWERFDRGQSAIRTALLGRGPPPPLPAGPSRRPAAAQVLAHLQAAFPHDDCPIAAFQHAMRSFFI